MSEPLRLVVFDMDGTLIDSKAFIVEAMRRGFAAAGHEAPAPEAVPEIIGLSLPVAVSRLAPALPEAEALRVAELYKAAFMDLRRETGGDAGSPLYPGAVAALERLAARPEVLMGVATGKARRGLDHVLSAHGLGRFFQTLQTADLHPSKPHPSMLMAALAETGAEARHAVMVGDTEYDMEMARAAGLTAIGVAWGYHAPDRLRAAGAEMVLEHYDELDAALASLAEPA